MNVLGEKSIEIVMVTNACGPQLRENPESGEQVLTSRTFRAGQKYKVARTPEIEEWLQRNYCYLASSTPPTSPPIFDAPIPAKRIRHPDEHSEMDETVDRLVDRGLTRLEQRLADKKGLLGRLFDRALEKLGLRAA